ncbi:hypothetical protein ABEP22_16850 [Bacillus safensis]
MKDKQIGVVHLVYGCIIALLIITFTLVIAFGGNKDAGNQMNVMATGISVVLAVIAILMTLVDVAGQRQSIVDIKETAQKLTTTQDKSTETLRETLKTFEELSGFKEDLLGSVAIYKNGTEKLIKNLSEELKKEETVSKKYVENMLEQIIKKSSDLDSTVKHLTHNSKSLRLNKNFEPDYKVTDYKETDYKETLIEMSDILYPNQKKVRLEVFINDFKFFFSKDIFFNILFDLEKDGYIITDNGEKFFLLEKFLKRNNVFK